MTGVFCVKRRVLACFCRYREPCKNSSSLLSLICKVCESVNSQPFLLQIQDTFPIFAGV